jgi:hypothetical protein
MDLLDFHQYDQDHQDHQDHQDLPDLPDLPPFAPLQRQDHWEPEIPMMRVSELKERLSAALNRTNTPLTFSEREDLRAALDGLTEAHVRMNDDYPVPPILSRIEAIPFEENRGIRGNGGSRKRSYRKRSYRKRSSICKRSYRKRSYRKKRGGSRRACMRSSFKKRSLRKRTLKKRYF